LVNFLVAIHCSLPVIAVFFFVAYAASALAMAARLMHSKFSGAKLRLLRSVNKTAWLSGAAPLCSTQIRIWTPSLARWITRVGDPA
jgi:hypothetical protein